MRTSRLATIAAAATLAAGFAAIAPAHADDATWELIQGSVESVPEPGSTEPVSITYTLYKPSDLGDTTVPLIFHSHGWGGSRTNNAGSFQNYLDAGYGVLSFDQRGFGTSGGKAHVENIDFEGEDVSRLVDVVAGLDWVTQEAEGDPLIGAIGGSYGGGYQMVGAFHDLKEGKQRFDALAPEITWWDVKESLAPQDVVRTTWVSALYAAGAAAHTDTVHQGFAFGAATGEWPKGQAPGVVDLDEYFDATGPRHHTEKWGQLDVPTLFGQGLTDNLFNLNQGLKNWEGAITDEARAESIFIGYNGGHALPEAFPRSITSGGDACSKALGAASFGDLAVQFFDHHLKGLDRPVVADALGTMSLTTNEVDCLVDIEPTSTEFPLDTLTVPVGAGAPIHQRLADGPLTIAGAGTFTGEILSAAADTRVFLGLSVGTSPADAVLVQDNVMPLRVLLPGLFEVVTAELPGVAFEVPEGQSLFLTASPIATMFAGHGSRTPGAAVFTNITVDLPIVEG